MIKNRNRILALVSACAMSLVAPVVRAQGITVVPITIHLAPGQMTSTLTVTNQGSAESSFQIRAFAWTQKDWTDRLDPTDSLVASPPLGTIPAGGSQTVRIVLRKPPQGREATYRILLDQIPPPAAPGGVRIALRLSIPVFVDPPSRAVAHLQWRIERNGGQSWLVAVNDGTRHESIRDIALATQAGVALKVEGNSPYVLAADSHRWRVVSPATDGTARLTAHGDAGAIDQPVPVTVAP